MNNLTSRQKNIINLLKSQGNYITAASLATTLQISVRTIKSEIKAITKQMNSQKSEIESINGRGYRLINKSPINKNKSVETLPLDIEERLIYVLRKLLVIDYHVKIDELADELYISRGSINQILKEIKNKLKSFRLKLVSRPKYGVLIEGSEIDKRLAISEYFFHSNLRIANDIQNESFYQNINYRDMHLQICNIINKTCDKYHIEMSDYSINNLATHISIAVTRCKFYNYVIVSDNVLFQMQNSLEFVAANEIIKELEKQNHFLMPIGETIYLAHHIKSKRILDTNKISIQESKKLKECIHLIFSEINNNFELNLSENSELYQYLTLHIPQMITRLKYHMPIRNPLIKDHMRRYLFATKLTHSACAIINQYYNVQIDKNEFGYLLLYFNLAITKFESEKQIKIGILTGRGRPEALMYMNEISEVFSSRKYKIEEINTIEQHTHFDLIISTYMVEAQKLPPIYIITNDNYIEEIRMKINEIRYHNLKLDAFFRPEFTFFNLEGNTKEEVLNHFYILLCKKEIIRDFPETYNALIDDELGNGIVHFQDAYRIVRKNLCFIAVLKKSVYWDTTQVRILILTKTKKECDKDLYNLCRVISKWSNDTKKVSELIKNQNFDDFFETIKRI